MVNVKSPFLLHIKVLPFSTCIDFLGKLNLLRISDEYRFYHADGVFILPQMAQINTDFFTKTLNNFFRTRISRIERIVPCGLKLCYNCILCIREITSCWSVGLRQISCSKFICVHPCNPWEINSSVEMIFFRKYLFRFILPQIAQIFTDFLLL